jgi:hypothetical protein
MDPSKDLPSFLLNASDRLIESNGWSPSEIGVYFRLILNSWLNGALPEDTKRLCKLCGISFPSFKKMWDTTLKFKLQGNGNGTLIIPWLEEVRRKQRTFRELCGEHGKKSAEKRANVIQLTSNRRSTAVEPTRQPDGNGFGFDLKNK